MLERLYISLWGIYFIALTLFIISGLFTVGVAVVFGFVFFGLTYMGMIGILPHYVTHSKTRQNH